MKNKILCAIRDISKPSVLLMFYGTKAAFGVLVIGISVFEYSRNIFIGGYNLRELSIRIIMAAVSLFIQFIVGGLTLDCVQKSRNLK